jgi:hypothetical protein
MPKPLIHARHERMFGKGRLRKRRAKIGDHIMLAMYDKLILFMDEAEHDFRQVAHQYPPQIAADLLATATETRRELQAQRQDLLTREKISSPSPTPRR